jgi:hypothetical protein
MKKQSTNLLTRAIERRCKTDEMFAAVYFERVEKLRFKKVRNRRRNRIAKDSRRRNRR